MKYSFPAFKTSALFGSAVAAALYGIVAATPSIAQEAKIPTASYQADEAENFWVNVSLPVYNNYFYRGIRLYNDTSFQPSVSASYALGDGSYGVIGASVWSHIPLGNNQNRISGFDENGDLFSAELSNKFVEVDPAVNYDLTVGMATLSVGHIWYTDPSEGATEITSGGETFEVVPAPNTAEFYGGVALDTFAQPSLTVYHDYRRFEFQYYALSFSERLDEKVLGDFFGKGFNVTPYALFGFATSADEVYNDESGLKHVNVGLRSTAPLGRVNMTPIIQYNFGRDEELNGVDRTPNDFFFGVNFSVDMGFAL